MKKYVRSVLIPVSMTMALLIWNSSYFLALSQSKADTVSYKTFSGKIQDEITGEAVVFANVHLIGSKLGTVTNSDGEFIIKIPTGLATGKIGITHLGYYNGTVALSDLRRDGNMIQLQAAKIPIDEVTVESSDALYILRAALDKMSENYSTEPVMLKSFYRETIKENRNYVGVAEAVIDVYKSSYSKALDSDRSKIIKGRKSQNVKKMDTLLVKLQGGPYTSLMLDIVKNPRDILAEEFIKDYTYRLIGKNTIDDRETFVINFKPKPDAEYTLYEGQIYVDVANMAIVGLSFKINMNDPGQVSEMLIRKKPAGMRIDISNTQYLTKYREVEGKWYLNYVRAEIQFKCKWEKKLFNSNYTTMMEMAVTDIDPENVEKFKFKESAKFSDVMSDQVDPFGDPEFWGSNNIIKPDESIELAIEKISRQLKRQL